MRLGINASRARSGGAISHLKGILSSDGPLKFGIQEVHIFGYAELISELPNASWIVTHHPDELSGSIFKQLWWERFHLPKLLVKYNCDILLNIDAGSICRFKPAVTMSRDMLSYEPEEMRRYGFTLARLRLELLKLIQNTAFKRAEGVIFLTNYAASVIQRSCGEIKNFRVINHGVSESFRKKYVKTRYVKQKKKYGIVYVSNVDLYKHQWNVVSAVKTLKSRGFNLSLTLIGGGKGRAMNKLLRQVKKSDPYSEFIKILPFLPHQKLPKYLAKADIFIFASSCENMPNTLIEGMAAGMPIASSNRGPMPEVLGDAGVYFEPESVNSIVQALEGLLLSNAKRAELARKAVMKSQSFNWQTCALETWTFLVYTFETYKISGKK